MKRTDFERLILKALSSPRTNLKSTKPHMVLRRPHRERKRVGSKVKSFFRRARLNRESKHLSHRLNQSGSGMSPILPGQLARHKPEDCSECEIGFRHQRGFSR